MKLNQQITKTVERLFEKNFNDSKAVAMLEEMLDEEYSNTENISIILDRLEELEEKVERLESEKTEVA